MNREEVLSLHTLAEEEQLERLKQAEILQRRYVQAVRIINDKDCEYSDIVNNGNPQNMMVWESLADCAFRLRDEADRELFDENFGMVVVTVSPELLSFWLKPIHWIQAALLAKLTSPSHPQA